MKSINEYKLEFSILVGTSDKYISLINGFLENLNKNWITNPFDIYVSLENKTYQGDKYPNVKLINTASKDWSNRIYNTLKEIKTEYIIFLLDDYWVLDKIDDSVMIEIFDFVRKNKPNHISYLSKPENYFHNINYLGKTKNLRFYETIKGQKYPYFIGVGYIYNVDFLKKILRKNETAWDFELNASFRYMNYKTTKNYRFYADKDPLGYMYGGIIHKGEVRPEAKIYFKKNHIDFKWENQKVNVSTKKTPIIIRLLRKLVRGPRRYLSKFFFKF